MVTRSMALLSLDVQRETNSCSSQEREAVLLLHDIYEADLDLVQDLILGHLTGDLEGDLEQDLLLSGVLLGDLE